MAIFLAAGIIFLNILDGSFTLWEIQKGLAVEANPIQAWLMVKLGVFWLPAKIALVSVLSIVLQTHYKNSWWARFGLWLCFVVYLKLIGWHLWGLFNL